jgi:hypothetical protein
MSGLRLVVIALAFLLVAPCVASAKPAGRSVPPWARRAPGAWACEWEGARGVCGLGKVFKVRNPTLRRSTAEARAREQIARYLDRRRVVDVTLEGSVVARAWDDGRSRAAAMVFAPGP